MANLSGKITTGARRMGRVALSFASDANKTLLASEWENEVLDIGSGTALTTTRNLIHPSPVDGDVFVVRNNATGAQSVQIIGPSGTGIAVATGKAAMVQFDGTNFIRLTLDA